MGVRCINLTQSTTIKAIVNNYMHVLIFDETKIEILRNSSIKTDYICLKTDYIYLNIIAFFEGITILKFDGFHQTVKPSIF